MTAILILAMASLLNFMFQRTKTFRLIGARDQLHSELHEYLIDDRAIQKTRDLNLMFQDCFGRGGPGTTLCPAQQDLDLVFYNRQGQMVAGTSLAPAYFDVDGFTCPVPGPSPQCPIKVYMQLRAQGIPYWENGVLQVNPVGSQQHEFIEIKYAVEVDDISGQPEIRQVTGSVILDTMDYEASP